MEMLKIPEKPTNLKLAKQWFLWEFEHLPHRQYILIRIIYPFNRLQ